MEEKVTLWRGYSYGKTKYSTFPCNDFDSLKEELLTNGDADFNSPHKHYRFAVPTVAHHTDKPCKILEKVLSEPDNIKRDNIPRNADGTRKQGIKEYAKGTLGIYVTGDICSAESYALRNNTGGGAIAEISVPIDRLVIDGRDFLYYAFSKCIRNGSISPKNLELMEKAFGKKIKDYLDVKSELLIKDSNRRFRYIDHICMDLDVISSHLASNVVLFGRYDTMFRNSFAVIDGVTPEEIGAIHNVTRSGNFRRNCDGCIRLSDF